MTALICGVDFSQWSESAASEAAAMAQKLNHELWLVHVVRGEAGTDAQRERLVADAKGRLDDLASKLSDRVKAKCEVVSGHDPASTLIAFARAHSAVGVVLGSAGHSNTPLVRVGATSERAVMGAEVPVIVLRAGAVFEPWSRGQAIRVLIAVDGSLASEAAVRWVERLRDVAPVDVVLGHVYYPDQAGAKYGLQPAPAMFAVEARVETAIERDLRRRWPTLRGSGEVFYRARLGVGRIGDHVVELAEAEGCQLLVMGAHAHRGISRMWSASAAALHVARCAVAVVPFEGRLRSERRPTLKRVFVTTDFSPAGNAAIPWAYSVVAPGGEVTVAHVDQAPMPSAREREVADRQTAARLWALPDVDAAAVVTRTEVLHGPAVAKAILEAAAHAGADCIVLASHGRSGFKRAALGSVAEEVLRGSDRPVFVVRVTE